MKLSDVPYPSSPPKALKWLGESRALLDMGSMALSFVENAFTDKVKRDSLPIILFPGFASDEKYMKPLGLYLQGLGYETEGWGLGMNLAGANLEHTLEDLSASWNVEPKEDYQPENYKGEGGVPYLCDLATQQVRRRSKELGSKVILIGWSLGGYLAREVARDLPDDVAQVITLGAPVIGGPKYTTANAVFKSRGFDLDWVEKESAKRVAIPINQPITAIFSRSDAIVDWRAAIDKFSPNVEHIQVNAAHLGMGFRRQIWRLIARTLEQQDFDRKKR